MRVNAAFIRAMSHREIDKANARVNAGIMGPTFQAPMLKQLQMAGQAGPTPLIPWALELVCSETR